jgi:trigger factor
MNIAKENVDALNAVLKINIEPSDYEENLNKALANYRRNAKIDGFRPGKVPAGIINKMYRKPALVDEINKLVSESISNFLKESDTKILGEPLPSETQKPIDWDNDKSYEFCFDLGIAPAVDIKLTKRDKVNYYTIAIDDEIRESYISSYQSRFGKMSDVDVVEGKEDFLRGVLAQENGITIENAPFSLRQVAKDEIKALFAGKKIGDTVEVNVNEAFENETDRAALLNVKKEELASINPIFSFTIAEIKNFEKAEVNQELYNKAFGEGAVNTYEEFVAKIDEEVRVNLSKESDYKLLVDLRAKLIEKADLQIPEAFLKRWIYVINEGKFTHEAIEKDFPAFAEDIKWQLIKENFITNNSIEVSEEELQAAAEEYASYQFAQYGMRNLPQEYVSKYASDILQNKEERRRIVEKKFEDKVVAVAKEQLKVEDKEVSAKEFDKLFEK